MGRLWIALGGLGLVVITLAVLGGAILLRGGISALPEPSAAEVRLARSLRSLLIPSAASGLQNPVPATPEAIAAGRAHFADHCAGCHANDGSGQTTIGQRLYPRAPDMRLPATQQLSDGELFFLIEQGVRLTGMPAWLRPGSAEGSWQLVHFIRHLPALTAEEKAEMDRLNPKSPAEWRALQDEDAFLRGEDPAPAPAQGTGAHAH